MAASQNSLIRKIAWLLLGFLFVASRSLGMEKLPLFSDEAYAVARAWELRETGELLGMVKYTTQPIFIWLVALFQLLPFGAVVNGRLVSGIFGLGAALLLAKLVGNWIDSRVEIPAFILMTILPFSVFYDRTILFESTTLFFMVLALVFPAATGLAVLTKQTGWLILPAVIAVGRGNFRERLLKTAVSVLAVAGAWILAAGSFSSVAETIIGKTAAPISASADLKNNLLRSKLWLGNYFTWPVIWLSVLGGAASALDTLRQKKITPLLTITVLTLGIFLFVNKTAVIFYPRYLYSIVLGVVLLAVKGWNVLRIPAGSLPHRQAGFVSFRMTVAIAIGFLVLIPSLISSWKIVMTPVSSDIPREDRFQFFEDWTSGVGSNEIADEIIKIAGEEEIKVYLEEENSYFITLKSDLRLKNAEVEVADWLVDPLTEVPKEVLASGKLSVIVRNRHPDIPGDWPVEKIFSFKKTAVREVSLYRVAEGSDLSKDLILQQ